MQAHAHRWASDPFVRHGWQHDGSDPTNPAEPGLVPQKVPFESR